MAAEKAGASFRYHSNVVGLVRPGGPGSRVTGVRLTEGEVVHADAVVLNPDLPVAYEELLPDVRPPRATRRGRYSPSCAVWLAGVRGALPPGVGHHNIHFGHEWEGSFDALMKRGEVMPDPSILITSPSLSDPSLAPAGRSSLYVLEPTPNLDGHVDWPSTRERFKDRLIARVEALGYPVEAELERFYDPTDYLRL